MLLLCLRATGSLRSGLLAWLKALSLLCNVGTCSMVRKDGSPPEKQNYPAPNTTGSLIANLPKREAKPRWREHRQQLRIYLRHLSIC